MLFVTSLEFIDDYKKAVEEAHRVLKYKGMVLILMLNPKPDYFMNEYKDRDSYIRKHIKHMDIPRIMECVSQYFSIEDEEYYLGIKEGTIFDSDNPEKACLYVIKGKKPI